MIICVVFWQIQRHYAQKNLQIRHVTRILTQDLQTKKKIMQQMQHIQHVCHQHKISRLQLSQKLQKMGRVYCLNDLQFSIMPASYETKGNMRIQRTMVHLRFEAMSDRFVLSFLHQIAQIFPGYIIPHEMRIDRLENEKYHEKLKHTHHAAQKINLSGFFSFEWITFHYL